MTFGILLVHTSCLKKPDACINTSELNPQLGEEVTLTNCSEDASESDIDFGDGESSPKVPEQITHRFESAGPFRVVLTSYNKKDASDEAEIPFVISMPDKSAIIGSWELYKSVEKFGYSDYPYYYSIPETWIFTESQVTRYSSPETYTYSSSGLLVIGSVGYQLIHRYDNEMTLRVGENSFFNDSENYYFRKK